MGGGWHFWPREANGPPELMRPFAAEPMTDVADLDAG
jgi:hypothetical protein